jgi:hypothetical protein
MADTELSAGSETSRGTPGAITAWLVRTTHHLACTVLLVCMIVIPVAYGVGETRCGGGANSSASALRMKHASAPQAVWIITENLRPGTDRWCIPRAAGRGIQGFADRVSAQVGDAVTLYVSAKSARYRVEAYRLGYYQGLGGRLIWTSTTFTGQSQPPPERDEVTNLVQTRWRPSIRFEVTKEWPPGSYLLKLVGADGSQSYIPLVIRDDRIPAALVIQLSVITWQAYNDWGGYNLYHGPGDWQRVHVRPRPDRARIVSFDRPYAQQRGAPLLFDEHVLVSLVERLGLDATYWTDVDLHEHPELLLAHRGLILAGHDEYWSKRMRDGATSARDRGVNMALLAANSNYRQVRLAPSPLGRDRLVIGYKLAQEDPMATRDPDRVSIEWRNPPVLRPESELNGTLYQCNPVNADMVVSDAANWLFDGTGLRSGDHLPHLVRFEYDRVDPSSPTPRTIQVLAHSPVVCSGRPDFADMTYYTTRSAAGVFDTATTAWLKDLTLECALGRTCKGTARTIERMTENLLATFGGGPAGTTHPSDSNLASLGIVLLRPIHP